jgi:hypothetical protein
MCSQHGECSVNFTLQLSTDYYFSAFVDACVWTYKNMCVLHIDVIWIYVLVSQVFNM